MVFTQTMADKKAETQEIIMALDLIKDIDEINDLNLISFNRAFYEFHIEELLKLLTVLQKWILLEAKLLLELSKMKNLSRIYTDDRSTYSNMHVMMAILTRPK